MTAADLAKRHWDVVVIGAGLGGGVVARRLAERGLSVLILEQGPKGYRREETPLNLEMGDPVARRLRGFWPIPIEARVNGGTSRFFAPLGAGVGGSSVFYAATLERPEPRDLDPDPEHPLPSGGWPVSYAEMAPYFQQVEEQFQLYGDQDPLSNHPSQLRPAPELSPDDETMQAALRHNGLHPYHLHTALKRVDGCKSCLGFKCPRRCKMDGRSAGVEPAVAAGAQLLDLCQVQELRSAGDRVTEVIANHDGTELTFHADKIVLAGGALSSPRLLLRSRAAEHPDGLANGSGQVGRNLMFHLNEMLAVWPGRRVKHGRDSAPVAPSGSKALGFRDLYHEKGEPLGMVQAMGIEIGYGEILHYLRQLLQRSKLRKLPLLHDLLRLPALIASKLFGSAQVYVGLLEDLPYPENRVVHCPDPDLISIRYEFAPELLRRRRLFRRRMRHAFKGKRRLFLGRAPDLNFGHPSGTLRFGDDPQQAVLNRDCRAHEVENLYVADASVFPSSMGVNPSLTIAALALRLADHIADHKKGTDDAQK